MGLYFCDNHVRNILCRQKVNSGAFVVVVVVEGRLDMNVLYF